jgi:hypothetical protein
MLASKSNVAKGMASQKLLLEAAAEIEGGEDAYAALVCEIDALRKKLAHTQQNLRSVIDMLPHGPG